MVNQTLLDKMVALRRCGYSMREIAEEVDRSERTVRRYVKDVEPQVELRDVFDTAQLMDWFYDEVLARRRWATTQAGEHWDESFDLGVEAVDSTMKLLRQRVESMEEISLRRLKSDEALRRQFFEEFISPVILRWISVLRGGQMQKMLDREFGPYGWEEVDEDAEDPDVWL